jgi:hypothetical protein
MANIDCCESGGGSSCPSGVRLNNSRGNELGDRIAGPGKVRCEVASVIIPPFPMLVRRRAAPAQLGVSAAIGPHTANRVHNDRHRPWVMMYRVQ